MKKILWVVIGLFLISVGLTERIYSEECVYEDGEIVEQHKVRALQQAYPDCRSDDLRKISDAKEIIKKYWKVANIDRYQLFSESYEAMLKRVYKIGNAEDYAKHFPESERTWQKQIYQNCLCGNNFIQITVLSTWYDEGYNGLMTFIFELIEENNTWKIANIKF